MLLYDVSLKTNARGNRRALTCGGTTKVHVWRAKPLSRKMTKDEAKALKAQGTYKLEEAKELAVSPSEALTALKEQDKETEKDQTKEKRDPEEKDKASETSIPKAKSSKERT